MTKKTQFTQHQIKDAFGNSGGKYETAAAILGVSKSTLHEWVAGDVELQGHRKAVKQEQKRRDIANTCRRHTRSQNRADNLVEALESELVTLLKENKVQPLPAVHVPRDGNGLGIVHLSDLHFGEIIDQNDNQFNLETASRAIHKHVRLCLRQFKAWDVSKVLFALTGDLVNSDRRMDEALTNADNRSKTALTAAQVISSAIADVSQYYPCIVASVVGNESRVNKDLGTVDKVASDSYDLMVHNIMELWLEDVDNVEFVPMTDSLECVLHLAGRTVLLHHGHLGGGKDLEKYVTGVISRYAAQGVNLDFALSGHIHNCNISDFYARSSGLPGANSYSSKGLNLRSRRSQNCYILPEDDTGFHGIKHDLQNVDGFEPYPYNTELEAYHSLYSKVNKGGVEIFKVVI